MKKQPLLLICCLFLSSISFAQTTLERQVIGSAGSYATSGDISVSATVGETATETAISGTLILTQGFQQPNQEDFVGIEDEWNIIVDYNIFPNPTADKLIIELNTDKRIDLNFDLYDLRGRATPVDRISQQIQGKVKTEMNLTSLAEGTYLLSLSNKDGKVIKSFRIQKIQ